MNRTPSQQTISLPATMAAIRVAEFGGTGAMRLEQVALPDLAEDEVLVQVHAAGVGPWDGWIRSGNSVLPQPLPLTLGSDIAGVIVAVGSKVTQWRAGAAVYGVTNKRFTGGYAQYAACNAGMIAAKPATLSFIEAASVPVIAVTAAQMLFDSAGLKAGDSVLIYGAAGNVGRYAVQLARTAGIRVIATGAQPEAAELHTLGAEQVIGRELTPVVKVDAVLDLVGGPLQTKLFDFLAAGGKLISAVSEPDQARARDAGVDARFMLVDVNTRALTDLATEFDEGKLHTWVGSLLTLPNAPLAHEMMEGRAARAPGKIVLDVGA
ncbi:MAG: NADP-dependent oxidoreductase [Massilia sp.]